jgi:predicted sulfurtransferase
MPLALCLKIILAEQGINMQLSGRRENVEQLKVAIRKYDARFDSIHFKDSFSTCEFLVLLVVLILLLYI